MQIAKVSQNTCFGRWTKMTGYLSNNPVTELVEVSLSKQFCFQRFGKHIIDLFMVRRPWKNRIRQKMFLYWSVPLGTAYW
jgi:hypothetical protein